MEEGVDHLSIVYRFASLPQPLNHSYFIFGDV
jgi:hypothetical protein